MDLEDNMKSRTQGSELLIHRYHRKGENPEKIKKKKTKTIGMFLPK